jgi:hypothetical protein
MTFTDSSGNLFMLSALFSQTGAVVSGVNFFEGGAALAFRQLCFFWGGKCVGGDQMFSSHEPEQFITLMRSLVGDPR